MKVAGSVAFIFGKRRLRRGTLPGWLAIALTLTLCILAGCGSPPSVNDGGSDASTTDASTTDSAPSPDVGTDSPSMSDGESDANECATGTPCGVGGASCKNTASSYVCTCKAGYSAPATGGTCKLTDACAAGKDNCDTDPPACMSSGSGFSCLCPTGFTGTGVGASGCLLADATLASLAPSTGKLSPAFASGTMTYELALPSGATGVKLTPTVTYPARATITVDGVAVASGSASSLLTLSGYVHAVAVAVTTESGAMRTYTVLIAPSSTYIKASNTEASDALGWSVALSSDGSTLAVGAIHESSNATGIDGDQTNNGAPYSGAVYVYAWSGTTWSQQAYVKASNTETGDQFGYAVALSSDGSTLAVSANYEASNATGIDGDQTDNSDIAAGAVYVFTRTGTTWTQQAYVKASNTDAEDEFGWSVALSGDGSTIAVGAYGESSNATGINGDQTNNTYVAAGAAYVFTRTGTTWSQQAYVKASNTDEYDAFDTVALSADGSTLAVGAVDESSTAAGIDGDQTNNSAANAGAVYVFTRSGTTWSQQAYVKASNTDALDEFGYAVALSSDGSTLAVGAIGESSNATGINGNQADNTDADAGAVYVFTRSGATWSQQAYVKASNTDADDGFGLTVALSSDGSTLAVGDINEASSATGIGGDQTNNADSQAGAVYVFTRPSSTWSQEAYVKASNTDAEDCFGWKVALSSDGSTLAVGATGEASNATGIGGDQTNNTASGAGAAYVY